MTDTNKDNKDQFNDEDTYVPENNNTSSLGSTLIMIILYLFLAALGIAVLGVVALFVVCMV